MLPHKPKISYRYLKSGIEEFHRKYVLVPADKAANNVVVVWRLHYIDTLKQELIGTEAYGQTFAKQKCVINNHIFHNATMLAVSVNEDEERLPNICLIRILALRSPVLQFQLPDLLLVCVLFVLFLLFVVVLPGEPRQKQGRGLVDHKLVQAP